MRFKMGLSEKERRDEAGSPGRSRKVSLGLAVGVLLMPVIFVWFLLRRGYSTKSQVIGIAWLGLIGIVLLLSAPHGPVAATAPAAAESGSIRSWESQTVVSGQDGNPSALDFELGATRSIYRMLRTSITLKNNLGRDLQYVEVFCSYYDGTGKLLGNGMSNWATVRAGDTVSGEVVASGVVIDDVRRRECRARNL